MKLFYFMYEENKDEYYEVPETQENMAGLEPKDNASKEAILGLYSYNIGFDEGIGEFAFDGEELSRRMIERFKNSKCYQAKSEEERAEIIQYLIDNPCARDPFIDI